MGPNDREYKGWLEGVSSPALSLDVRARTTARAMLNSAISPAQRISLLEAFLNSRKSGIFCDAMGHPVEVSSYENRLRVGVLIAQLLELLSETKSAEGIPDATRQIIVEKLGELVAAYKAAIK